MTIRGWEDWKIDKNPLEIDGSSGKNSRIEVPHVHSEWSSAPPEACIERI